MDEQQEDIRADAVSCEVEEAARQALQITDEDAFDARIGELAQAHPDHPSLVSARVRWLVRHKKVREAVELIDNHDFGDRSDVLEYMLKAELLYEAHEHERARELFTSLMDADEQHRRDVAIRYARRLFTDGFLCRALDVLEPVRDRFGEGGKGHAFIVKLDRLHALLTRLEGRAPASDENCRMLAMKHAILSFRGRTVRKPNPNALGRLTLITGGLGPGGAERQLSRLASELELVRKRKGAIAGILLDRPVEVLVRSHEAARQNDFYLGDIVAAGVEVHQINLFPVVPPAELCSDPELLALLDYLPARVNFGVRRMTRHFIRSGTDVASVWQDGACLFAGLAALLAGVPQIQLAIRGLPPSVRKHMFLPEYEVFYRAMAQVPGVSFISNSKSAARAYADWLGVEPGRFHIVYNGVEPMSPEPSESCERRWTRFVEATADADHTVGGVFRFNTDKQPLLWVRFAARYLKRHPRSRIVLVGSGRLLPNAQKLAEELGIGDRILFVGSSNRVGFWMSKMDVLVLLSRYEGLPNVLIEAQYMGVRVVTTPAGGAAECLIDGVTGHVLGCAERPDYAEVVERANAFAMRSGDREMFDSGGVARTFLDSHFSIAHMLSQYVQCTARALQRVPSDQTEAPHSLQAA